MHIDKCVTTIPQGSRTQTCSKRQKPCFLTKKMTMKGSQKKNKQEKKAEKKTKKTKQKRICTIN